MAISGKLEITIKITDFPTASTVENGWKFFEVECDGQMISVNVMPKVWKKLEGAQAKFPQWVAAITGKMGEATEQGFVLLEPTIQVFEKKAKAPTPE
ncbi:MAG: fertility inhibition FinO-like protein [Anaerolineae bacterium]|nr:fertility inhibition FinO-like protein [Gloeobacterales cyanobacterium ES-bin-313]